VKFKLSKRDIVSKKSPLTAKANRLILFEKIIVHISVTNMNLNLSA
jgi:hypothetical protein